VERESPVFREGKCGFRLAIFDPPPKLNEVEYIFMFWVKISVLG